MNGSGTDPACTLCGEPVDSSSDGRSTSDGGGYCSPGCRAIDHALDETDPDANPADSAEPRSATARAGERQTFLRIDGLQSPTGEAFLESAATAVEGVSAATASYVTETVRVTHEAGVDQERLVAALSPLGYDAYPRGEAGGSRRAESDAPLRSREMDGIRKRRSDQLLGFRYAAGVLFGSFLLIPYVVLAYPAHLASMVDLAFLELYEDAFQLQGMAGLVFLRLYAILTGFVLVFTGLPVLRGAYASLRTRRPNTDLLVAITVCSAYLYSIAAVLSGRNDVFFDLTVVVAAAVAGAVLYETSIKQRALSRLTDLTVSQVDDARRYDEDGSTTEVPVDDLTAEDRVLVPEGERVPVDGTLLEGPCTLDESIVTGESVPVRRTPGDHVSGGSIVTDGAAVVAVDEEPTSGIDRITSSMWNIQSTDHGVQQRADRVARIAAPGVVLAALVAIVASYGQTGSLVRATAVGLAVLLVASPWALGLASPLAVARSLRAAMERGIVVFDETIFERLTEVDVVVFDKTGTLTTGSMELLEADAPPDLLADVAALERRAAHPAADVIAAAFGTGGTQSSEAGHGQTVDHDAGSISGFATHDAGVTGTVSGRSIAVGSLDLFAANDWTVPADLRARVERARGFGRLPVVVGRDGRAEGLVVVGDEPREGWEETLAGLDDRGIDVVVLTGDDEEATTFFDRHDAVDRVFANVPPAGKTTAIRRLAADRDVAMVGDGTNDAPALAAADLGISLGSGTALAADAADVAIATDDLRAIDTAFELARAARSRVRQNTALALLYNAIAIPVAAFWVLNPVTAMGAVVAAGGTIGINSVRRLLPAE